jgi:hypothetical protein
VRTIFAHGCLVLLPAAMASADQKLTIRHDGKSDYVIVIPSPHKLRGHDELKHALLDTGLGDGSRAR